MDSRKDFLKEMLFQHQIFSSIIFQELEEVKHDCRQGSWLSQLSTLVDAGTHEEVHLQLGELLNICL